jgi:uncharacterized protein YbjT (DUF2867 family)
MSDMDQAREAIQAAEHARTTAVVLGAGGRVGGAFARRLAADGYPVLADPDLALVGPGAMLFDCAYGHGEEEAHVVRVAAHLARWRHYLAIFVPSSLWAGQDSAYGRAKQEVERMAAACQAAGGRVVVDPIGYFPGDGVAPDPAEPMIGALVTGDALYARVMARMLVRA